MSGDFCTEAVKSTGWRFIDGSSCGNRETGTCVLGWAVTCSFSVTASCWDFLVYLHFKMFITICTKLLIKPEGKKKKIYIYIYTHTHTYYSSRYQAFMVIQCYIGGIISFASTVIFLFIYIRHIWTKPVPCSRIVSLFHHTSPWTHRCLQSSYSAHRNGREFRHSVQTACCYWILNSNWNSQTNASRLWWSSCWYEYSKTW